MLGLEDRVEECVRVSGQTEEWEREAVEVGLSVLVWEVDIEREVVGETLEVLL